METGAPRASGHLRPIAGPGSVDRLHHVGHVVRDMDAAAALYRRLGFRVPPPAFPALQPRAGDEPRAFGAGNAHIGFSGDFVELVTVLDGAGSAGPGGDARVVALEAPPEALARLTEKIERTAARIGAALDRFEGLHILVLEVPDVDAAGARLTAGGVAHSGANRVRRPEADGAGGRSAAIGYLEIDGDPALAPEGRIALAEPLSPADPLPGHPNGATRLVESVLCVAADDLAAVEHRYTSYLGRAPRSLGSMRVFDLTGSRLVLVAAPDLDGLLPGERPPALPAFVAFSVAVRDPDATRALLGRNGVPVRETPAGDPFVPAAEALGAAVIFRAAG